MPQFKNSCCVPLDDEQVMVDLDEHGRPLAKYLIRIEGRPLTRDEALALAAAPGTRAERAAAVERVWVSAVGLEFQLVPSPWLPGEMEQVVEILERRSNADIDNNLN